MNQTLSAEDVLYTLSRPRQPRCIISNIRGKLPDKTAKAGATTPTDGESSASNRVYYDYSSGWSEVHPRNSDVYTNWTGLQTPRDDE